MRIITWNVNGANSKSPVWKLLLELKADIILLQEVGSMPEEVREVFDVKSLKAIYKNGNLQRFSTAVLVRGKITGELHLISEYEWVNQELEFFRGNLISCIVRPKNEKPINVVSVYSPAWSLNKVWDLRGSRPSDTEINQIKLKFNPEVWVTEILWSALKKANLLNMPWIVGGDFNSSETFDLTFSSGNREILDRMEGLGFTECLRKYTGKLTSTFKNTTDGKIIHQIDHLFATNDLYSRLNKCSVGSQSEIFGKSLSDHLPIIADFA